VISFLCLETCHYIIVTVFMPMLWMLIYSFMPSTGAARSKPLLPLVSFIRNDGKEVKIY
jgi:ABC-type glycerol-3-phosphate transport system permease component